MSLINDALKKAQNLQARPAGTLSAFPRPTPPAEGSSPAAGTLSPATTPPPEPTATIVPPRRGKSPHSALIVMIAVTVLVAGVGAIGYVAYALFFMGPPEEQTVAATPQLPAAVKTDHTSTSTLTPSSAPAADTLPTANPAPAAASASGPQNPAEPAGASPQEPVPVPAAVATSVATTPVTNASAPTSAAEAPAAPDPVEEIVEERINHPKPHIQAWVDKITVSGIRPGDKPKALMNDRVFIIGDVVNRELGLQLYKISDRLLVFEDAEGNTYDYTF